MDRADRDDDRCDDDRRKLGARLTGSGFIVFTVGSICWMVIGLSSGQTNLLATNAFLTIVNLVGIWRWLGRQRAYEDGGRSAEAASRRSAAPNLFTATGVAGRNVVDSEGPESVPRPAWAACREPQGATRPCRADQGAFGISLRMLRSVGRPLPGLGAASRTGGRD